MGIEVLESRDAGITTLRVQPDGETPTARLETLGRLMQLVAEVNTEPARAGMSA